MGLLPQVCPQCGWEVENLPGEPSAEYRAKLLKAQEVWQAGGEVQARAKRLLGLFELIDTAWKAGQWTDTLECYDKVLKIDPQNERVSRERPVALFCFIESLLQVHAKSIRHSLRCENVKDHGAIDKLMAAESKFESVGMSDEAVDAREQTASLNSHIKERNVKLNSLNEAIPSHYLSHYQQGGPTSVPRNQRMSLEDLLSAHKSQWSEIGFVTLLWNSFVKELSNLPQRELRYVEEFKTVYDRFLVGLRSNRKRARAALTEARGLINSGNFTAAYNSLNKAESLDLSLSRSVASLRAHLASRKKSAESAQRDRRRARKRFTLWFLRVAGALVLLAGMTFVGLRYSGLTLVVVVFTIVMVLGIKTIKKWIVSDD